VTKKLRDCVKRKAPSSAVDLLVSLGRDHGIEPDARAASTCIAACIAGRDLDMAEKVFEQVFEGGVCEPDEIAVVELVAESDEFMRQDDERVRDHKNCGDVQRFIAMLREYERF
jgi:hypothetical protein